MRTKTSKYRGVSLYSKGKYWLARITKDKRRGGKTRFLGMYVQERIAAQVYDKAAQQLFGESAILNFPEAKNGDG